MSTSSCRRPSSGARRSRGTVTDDTGAPVPNATVFGDAGVATVTDENGHYVIANFVFAIDSPTERDTLVTGRPMKRARTIWYGQSRTVHVVDGQTTTVDFVFIRRKNGKISGLVRDAVTLEPIAGATLINVPDTLQSGADGRFVSGDVFLGLNNAPRSVGMSAAPSCPATSPPTPRASRSRPTRRRR